MGFEEFVGRRLGALLRYAAVLTCDSHLAEDIVQDVLLKAHLHWERVAAMQRPEAYLKRMIVNELVSWRRRRLGRGVVDLVTLESADPAAADPTAGVDERDALLRRIAALPARQRAVIALRYYEGRTDEEIADLLGCSVVTVRSHCSRALATLRLAMGVAHPMGRERR